jgi:hypothetical protein
MAETQTDHALAKGRSARDLAIEESLPQYAECPDKDLLAEMIVTVCRMAADQTRRGELKLVSRSMKELRYAFKVFTPYSEFRKVNIFGSSRTPIDHADYAQADCFARRMREARWMVITGAGDGIMRAHLSSRGCLRAEIQRRPLLHLRLPPTLVRRQNPPIARRPPQRT